MSLSVQEREAFKAKADAHNREILDQITAALPTVEAQLDELKTLFIDLIPVDDSRISTVKTVGSNGIQGVIDAFKFHVKPHLVADESGN